ncbi:MAG: NAD-dependent epimerase/dehydratase family protein [Xanthomonadales bacterium]|nr:NAD-dependent epimerase/dehydratase family protein [Gammaproteobacteria bacterium]MBT8054764.1 NAD-dependent epimerase/dehydratase family protein [Gammaproteobacteria bacterium]NND58557.1 NAD-dependent epimerase/dehydratase family protein [Xanthomonadales bacterium]NNK52251.1 NAD-dependent epimerase/dehydratase family protein [Xanthomonadales bacterium]
MKILVTGGGGFLGSSICRQLTSLGHEVLAYQRNPADHLEAEGVRSITGDITDAEALASAATGCGAIVHTAGKAGIWGDPEDYRRINVDGTANVIDACRRNGIPVLVHTSSPSIVHSGGDISGADESLPIADHFTAPYPESKAAAEKMITAANAPDLFTAALRPHLIWGPGDPHILPRLAAKAAGGTIALPGPDKLVDTIFVENAALAHVKALQELIGAARCAGKAYFVTNNQPMPQGEIIAKFLAAIGIKVRIRAVPVPLAMGAGALAETVWRLLRLKSEPPVTRFSVEQLATAHWFDTRAAVQDFGYTPVISIEEGLERLREQGL